MDDDLDTLAISEAPLPSELPVVDADPGDGWGPGSWHGLLLLLLLLRRACQRSYCVDIRPGCARGKKTNDYQGLMGGKFSSLLWVLMRVVGWECRGEF